MAKGKGKGKGDDDELLAKLKEAKKERDEVPEKFVQQAKDAFRGGGGQGDAGDGKNGK
jgi:hypothetical protein